MDADRSLLWIEFHEADWHFPLSPLIPAMRWAALSLRVPTSARVCHRPVGAQAIALSFGLSAPVGMERINLPVNVADIHR